MDVYSLLVDRELFVGTMFKPEDKLWQATLVFGEQHVPCKLFRSAPREDGSRQAWFRIGQSEWRTRQFVFEGVHYFVQLNWEVKAGRSEWEPSLEQSAIVEGPMAEPPPLSIEQRIEAYLRQIVGSPNTWKVFKSLW